MFGYTITRKSTAAADDPTLTPSAAYRAQRAKTAVPEMLHAITHVKWMTTAVLVVGLIALYGHQATFLADVVGKLGLLVPGVVDLGMLAMMVQAQTTAMTREAKRRAVRVFLALTSVSVVFNVLASLPHTEFLAEMGWLVEALVFAVIVGVVGAVKWAATAIAADFSALEAAEAACVAPEPAPVTVAGCPHPTPCVTEMQCARKTAATATRRDNAARTAAAKTAAADARRLARQQRRDDIRSNEAELFARIAMENEPGYADSVAPVSPAIA